MSEDNGPVSEDNGPDPLVVIEELTAALEGARDDLQSLRDELKSVQGDSETRDAELAKSGQRRGRILTGIIVSICLDLLITAGFGWTTVQVNDAQNASTQLVQALHTAQLTVCMNGNTFRANQTTIWRDFIALIAKPSAGEPAAQIAKTDQLATQFLAYVTTVNHSVNCTALYGK